MSWECPITCMCYTTSFDLIFEMCDLTHTSAFVWHHSGAATTDSY